MGVDMEQQQRTWATDVKAFGWLTLLNFVLVCGGLCPGVLCGLQPECEMWFWVVAFPARLASVLRGGWDTVAWSLLMLNPLFYGAMWWLVWKAYRLVRL